MKYLIIVDLGWDANDQDLDFVKSVILKLDRHSFKNICFSSINESTKRKSIVVELENQNEKHIHALLIPIQNKLDKMYGLSQSIVRCTMK